MTEITSDIDDKIKYKLKNIQKGEKYSLEIKTRSGIKESFQGKIVLKTNSQKKPEIDLFVYGKLLSTIKVSPQYLYYGIIDNSKEVINPKSLKRTVLVNEIRGDGLTIEKIEPSRDWIITETKTNQKGKQYAIVISLNKEKLPKGQFREKIDIHTKDEIKSSVVSVIIEGKII